MSNKAVRRTTGHWLRFLDDYGIPHSKWIADHVVASRWGEVLCGRRVKLGPWLTAQVDTDQLRKWRLEGLVSPVLGRGWSEATNELDFEFECPLHWSGCYTLGRGS